MNTNYTIFGHDDRILNESLARIPLSMHYNKLYKIIILVRGYKSYLVTK